MSAEENARWLSARGVRVEHVNGLYWRVDQGRWQPTHFFARVPAAQIRVPGHLCWAYRAAVAEADGSVANGAIPMHMVDLEHYSLEGLRSSKRRQIRASLKRLEFIEISEPGLLIDQGLGVVRSAVERHGYGRTLSQGRYRKMIEAYYETRGGLVLGAMEGNQLRGYVTVHAAGDSAYIEEVHLASDALDTQIGPGLTHQAALACTRNPDIRHLIHSLVTPERPGLTRFKQQMGFPIVEVPARYWMAPGFRQLLERFHPNAYYRFTGHGRPAPAGENVED